MLEDCRMRLPDYGKSIRRLLPAAVLSLALFSAGLALSDDAPQPPPVRPALEDNRGPYGVAFTPDGTRALVTEFDEGALAIIDRASGAVLRHVPTGGEQPTGVAVTADGARAVVTNSF